MNLNMRRQPIRTVPTFELPVRWDFPCRTNSDFTEELWFCVGSDPLDLTGHSFEMQIRTAPNSPAVLKELDTVTLASSEGIFPVEPSNGIIQVRVNRDSILTLYQNAHPSILEGDCVSLYYDFLVTLPSADKEAWLVGYFNISKGITNG